MEVVRGRAWVFGDDVDTDAIAPSRCLSLPDARSMASHLMEPIRPGFASQVEPGDILVAGHNFGCGSSREQAVRVIKTLAIQAVVAESFGRIFFRNAINDGLLLVQCPGVAGVVHEGEMIEIDLQAGRVRLGGGGQLSCTMLPPFLMAILSAGGLVPYLLSKEVLA